VEEVAKQILTPRAILDVLDAAASGFGFPALDNGYVYPVDIRLSVFGDGSRWAVVFDWLGVQNRAVDFRSALYAYGNCLVSHRTEADFVSPEAFQTWLEDHPSDETLFLSPVSDGPSGPLLDPDRGLRINPDATDLRIRGRVVPLPRDPAVYRRQGVVLEEPPALFLYELMRCLVLFHRPALVSTDEEMDHLVPRDLPLLLRLDEWHHPDLVGDERPSHTQAFQMIAAVLVHADATYYRPTEAPNTHWSNWPGGGTL
jgi:hypothetical protein